MILALGGGGEGEGVRGGQGLAYVVLPTSSIMNFYYLFSFIFLFKKGKYKTSIVSTAC